MKIGAETAAIKAHDAVPLNFNQTKSFEATGSAPLELMAVGVVKDAARRFQIVGRNPYMPARGTPPARERGRGLTIVHRPSSIVHRPSSIVGVSGDPSSRFAGDN